jgi:histidine triad (HIT) family protein
MSTIFTRIIQGEIPCHRVAEDERFLAFLDIRPVATGHTLVVPKREVNELFDLDDETMGGLWVFAKAVAAALKRVVPCARVGVMVAGLEVPHAHVHLVPFTTMNELHFANAKPAAAADLAALATRVRTAMGVPS